MNTWYINKCPFCNSYSVCFYYKNGGFLTVDCGRQEIYTADNTAGYIVNCQLYRVYKKKLNRFKIALNFAKKPLVYSF